MLLVLKNGKLSIGLKIPTPPEPLWDLLTDTSSWPLWGPSVRKVSCPTRHITAESKGSVQTALGFWLPFTITEFTPLHHWHWRVGGLRATEHSIVRENNRCLLFFSMPWWSAPYALVCAVALLRIRRLLVRKLSDPVNSLRSDPNENTTK